MFDIFYTEKPPENLSQAKYAESLEHARQLSRTRFFWIVNYLCDYSGFDFLWEPPPWQNNQRHAWSSCWQVDSGTYLIPKSGFSDTNYHVWELSTLVDRSRWQDIVQEFDLSWHPDYRDPPFIYQFGTQWQKTGGPRYVVPGATEIKYVEHPRLVKINKDQNWECVNEIEYRDFDFTWHPDATEKPFIYQFGTQWQKTGGPRYVVPGATEIKYVSQPRSTKTTRDQNWEYPPGIEYDGFDWTWHPDATEKPFIYQFGTQWQKTGGPVYRVPGATEIKYVDQIRVELKTASAVAIVIDHLDGNAQAVADQIKTKVNVIKITKYVDNYLDTLRRLAKNCDDNIDYIWICSSICDYQDFDFTWHPEQWQSTMLHVFASGSQKFGDTFLMHVPSFRARCEQIKLLDWYDINFIDTIPVTRRSVPVISHRDDSQVGSIKSQSWMGPVALFTTVDLGSSKIPYINLWREQTKTVIPLDESGAAVLVPRCAVPYIKTQIYDYPHIDRSHAVSNISNPLDIIFISNGEYTAQHHWQILEKIAENLPNRLRQVKNINGRVAAYHAAAEASNTAWFFAVFAKLQVNEDFDWTWQPDRLQQAKHYIFHAYNPVNYLVYGHQAVIAYNRNMALQNPGLGLDFTLDQPHEVVPMISGTAYYDSDPWTCWRTAFRECLKLRHSLPDVENEYRLNQWLEIGESVNGHWSKQGARDAVEYYASVNGDFESLKKSYEWDWLASYALLLHPELVTQSSN
jgi:hypothetical protein